jgi:hypothetical protein
MSVPARRRITTISLAIDVLILVILVTAGSLSRFHHWRAGFTGIAFAAVSIVAGLLYLRSTKRKAS